MTTSRLLKVLLFISMLLIITVWILNQGGMLSYPTAATALALMAAGLAFVHGAKLQQMNTEKELKQQKRDEHERIERLLDTDEQKRDNNKQDETTKVENTTNC